MFVLYLSVALHEHSDKCDTFSVCWGYDGINREEKANDSLVTQQRGIMWDSALQTQPKPAEEGSSDQV